MYYLNPDWLPGHGGELALHVRADVEGSTNEVVQVPPLLDRLVVFDSKNTPHEVLPAYSDRYAVTVWYVHVEEAVKYANDMQLGEASVESVQAPSTLDVSKGSFATLPVNIQGKLDESWGVSQI